MKEKQQENGHLDAAGMISYIEPPAWTRTHLLSLELEGEVPYRVGEVGDLGIAGGGSSGSRG